MENGMPDETPIPEAELVDLHLHEKGLDFRMRHPIVPVMAEHLAAAFKAAGGTNYVSFEIDSSDLGPLLLTMQRRWGDTPERQAARYRAALERIAEGATGYFDRDSTLAEWAKEALA